MIRLRTAEYEVAPLESDGGGGATSRTIAVCPCDFAAFLNVSSSTAAAAPLAAVATRSVGRDPGSKAP